MVIYLDLILIYTFVINGSILLLVGYLLKYKRSFVRWLFGTILATMFVPLILYFPHSVLNTFFIKCLYSILIIIVCFGFKSFYQLFKNVITFYTVSFIAGGTILSIHYVIEYSKQSPLNSLLMYVENMYGDDISLVIIFIGFPLSLLFTKMWSDKMVTDHFNKERQYEVTLRWNGFKFQTIGFLDSGNQLVDPLTNRPVVICDETFMKQFFSITEWTIIKKAIQTNSPDKVPDHLYTDIAIVPFKTVAGDNHFLFAIKPDKLTIKSKQKRIIAKKVLVGIQLSNMTNDGQYHCLLHPHLLTLERAA